MTDLIKSLRSHHQLDIVDFDLYLEAATALESQHALVALLRASLRQSEAEVEGLRRDAERYRWLRRRAVAIDGSDETVTKVILFKNEGPTGEFLDDQIDTLSQTKEHP